MAVAIGAGFGALRGTAATDDTAAWRNSGLIARIHFAGTGQIRAASTDTNLNAIFALPETAALREQTFQKLAVAPYNFFRRRAGITNNESALVRPLLDDVFRSESFVEMMDGTNDFPESVFALRLNEDRAQLWSKNLSTVLAAWSGIPVTAVQADGFKGWELRKHKDPNLFRFFRAGDWIVIGWGNDNLHLEPAVLKSIRETGRPVAADNADWLDAWADWPALATHHLAPESIKLPPTRLVVQGRKGFVRSELTLKFPAPLALKLDPWRIPTNIIHNPIVSFTATRGLAPWLNSLPQAKEHNLPRLPEQVYVWSLTGIPLQTYWAAPVSTGYFDRLRPGLVALLNSFLSSHRSQKASIVPGQSPVYSAVVTNQGIEIRGMPFIVPRLVPIKGPGGDYVAGGLMPGGRTQEPLPPALLKEVMARPTLVFYGWEYTSERLKQWDAYFALGRLLFGSGATDVRLPAHQWLEAVWSKLGNASTEVSLTAPDELTAVRNSTVGFTGVELCAWAYWLDSPEFPLGAYGNTPRLPGAPRLPSGPH